MDGVTRIGVSLEPELLKAFDESISKKGYVSRSEAIRDLVRALENGPISRRDFEIVIAADNGGKIPDWLSRYDEYLAVLKSAANAPVPERLHGARIGEYIRGREAQALMEFIMNEAPRQRGGKD